jgi:hypothetical protein
MPEKMVQSAQAEECGVSKMSAYKKALMEYRPFTVVGKCSECGKTVAVDVPSLQGAFHICMEDKS